jgi:hypothetical protein
VNAFNALSPGDQLLAALTDPGVPTTLDTIDYDVKSGVVKSLITATRKRFLQGRISRVDAEINLRKGGLQEDRIRSYIDVWSIELTESRRELSTNQILKFYREGLVTVVAAGQYLANLGWAASDAALLLADVQRSIALDLAKAQAAAARTLGQQQRAQAAAIRAAQAEQRRLAADMARHGSPKELVLWMLDGLVTEKEVRRRLAVMEWPLADQDRLIKEETDAYNKKHQAKPRKIVQPTVTELLGMYKDGVIGEAEMRVDLRQRGYDDRDIDRYVLEAKIGAGESPSIPASLVSGAD